MTHAVTRSYVDADTRGDDAGVTPVVAATDPGDFAAAPVLREVGAMLAALVMLVFAFADLARIAGAAGEVDSGAGYPTSFLTMSVAVWLFWWGTDRLIGRMIHGGDGRRRPVFESPSTCDRSSGRMQTVGAGRLASDKLAVSPAPGFEPAVDTGLS